MPWLASDSPGAKYRGSHHSSLARGDLSRQITVDVKGEILELKDTINTMVDQAERVLRVRLHASLVKSGPKGNSAAKPRFRASAEPWKGLDRQRQLHGQPSLTGQVRNIAEVGNCDRHRGTLSRKITVDVRGEILQLKGNRSNTMVDQLKPIRG